MIVLEGKLSPRALGLVMEWASSHQTELMADWNLARGQAPLKPIEPLRQPMLKDIVDVRPLGGYQIHLRFEDGVEGDLDLGEMIEFQGIFAPLRDEKEFAKVRLHPELGTIVWPNGADLDPDVLYAKVTGKPIDLTAPAARKA